MLHGEMEDTCFIKKTVEIERKDQANWKDCNRFPSERWEKNVPETFLLKFKQTVM